MYPLVSAIILTHNRKQLVTRAIDSVLLQTYPNLECIVVDDASSDGTYEVLAKRDDIKYVYIPQSESKGGNYARNSGIKVAKGKYVAMLDDDDYWLPTKIEKQVALIEEKGCDLVYCGSRPEYVLPDGTVSCRFGAFFSSKKTLVLCYASCVGLALSLFEDLEKL